MTLRLNLILPVERLILWAENKNADPVWAVGGNSNSYNWNSLEATSFKMSSSFNQSSCI